MGCWDAHQQDHMQTICTSLQTDDQHLITQFLQAGCSSWHPTDSVKALKARTYNTLKKNFKSFIQQRLYLIFV